MKKLFNKKTCMDSTKKHVRLLLCNANLTNNTIISAILSVIPQVGQERVECMLTLLQPYRDK